MKTLWFSFFLKISDKAYISAVSEQKTKIWPLYLSLSMFRYVRSSESIAFWIFLTISSYFEGRYRMLTGNIRPETFKVFFLKYLSKREISMDAEVMMTLKFDLFCNNYLTKPRMTSILIVLS